MKIFIVILLIITSCSNSEQKKVLNETYSKEMETSELKSFDFDNIENNFVDKTGNLKDDVSKINKSVSIPYEVIYDKFLYPVNETIYEKSYIKSRYYAGYRLKIADNIWILCYLHHFDLHSEELIWTIYDSKNKQVKSNLVIASWNENTEKKVNYFDGQRISISTTYKRSFKNGMEGDNSRPIEVVDNFEIEDSRFIHKK